MTLKQWDEDISEMSLDDLIVRRTAIETLAQWPTLKREFGWTGIFTLGVNLRYELVRKGAECDQCSKPAVIVYQDKIQCKEHFEAQFPKEE